MFQNHPRGLPVLFFTEMWERFGYYLMLGIFVLYMTDAERGGLAFGTAQANEIYGWFLALVYLTPFFGGMLADRHLGYRNSVVVGGILMAAGYLTLGLVPGMTAFYVALAVIIVGNGFFKPNISTLVGRLYPEGSKYKDTGYNIFYMGINIGAFVCNFVAAILRNRFGWGYAFAAAGVGMLIGVVWFLMGQKHLEGVNNRGDGTTAESGLLGRILVRIFLPAIAAGVAGFVLSKSLDWGSAFSFFNPGNTAFVFAVVPVIVYFVGLWATAPREDKGPIGALLAIFAVVIVFWAVFHQNGNTLTLWARDYTARQAGPASGTLELFYMNEVAPESYWDNVPPAERPADRGPVNLISTELFQSVNPFFVVFLTPVVVGFFAALRRRGKEPSTPAKIAWGLFISGVSTLLMVAAVRLTNGGEVKASMGWLIGTYGVITVGELCLSPMGLSLVSKLSPARLTGVMMGGWFVSTAFGNKVAGIIGGLWDRVDSLESIFWINCALMMGAALVAALIVPWIRRVMAEHEADAEARRTAAAGSGKSGTSP